MENKEKGIRSIVLMHNGDTWRKNLRWSRRAKYKG